MSAITQDKNGDLHLHLDPDEVPSNVAPTKAEKQEVLDDLANFLGDFGKYLRGASK